MTDEKFTELVNLYFDKEISAEDLKRLKSEIATCPERKRAFAERSRLDKAMRLALEPKSSRSRRSHTDRSSRRSHSGRSSRSSRSRSGPTTKISEYEAFARARGRASLPRWFLGSGLAACLVLGVILLSSVFQDTTDPDAQPELVGVSERELGLQDAAESLGREELRRYVDVQKQREAKYHASLIAQMRLMGLRPELTPADKQLREVRLAALPESKHKVNQAELFQRIQGMKAMPDPELLRIEDWESISKPVWSGSFESSLVGFEEL